MKEKLVELVGDKISSYNVFIDDVYFEEEGSETFLRVVLDSINMIDLNTVVMVTRILNPIIDKCDFIEKENYILDVFAKSKGDVVNEQ